jgi:hypothetical protein
MPQVNNEVELPCSEWNAETAFITVEHPIKRSKRPSIKIEGSALSALPLKAKYHI